MPNSPLTPEPREEKNRKEYKGVKKDEKEK